MFKPYSAIITLLLSICFSPSILLGQEMIDKQGQKTDEKSQSAGKLDFQLSKQANLAKYENAYRIETKGYWCQFDLGELGVDQKGEVELEITNPYDESIEFSEAKSGCTCVSFLSETKKQLLPKESIKLKFALRTPGKSERPTVVLAINFSFRSENSEVLDQPAISVKVSYKLNGNLAFKDSVLELQMPEDVASAELRAEFVYNSPIELKNLEVMASRSLADIPFEMSAKSENVAELVGVVPGKLVVDGPIGGELALKDKVSGRRVAVWATVRKSEDVKFSPMSLVFRLNKEEGVYQSTALIRIIKVPKSVGTVGTDSNEPAPAFQPDVSCFLGNKRLDLKKVILGNRTVRLDLRIKAKDVPKNGSESEVVETKIQFDGEEYSLKREASFTDR